MIRENSGKMYQFKLDHELGYSFSEVYDFTDDNEFDGRVAFVFNLIIPEPEKIDVEVIRQSGIGMGPFRLARFPNTRGKLSWKFLDQSDRFLIEEMPVTKELKGLLIENNNWNEISGWYRSDFMPGKLEFLKYEVVRSLETRILTSNEGISVKTSMKRLIDTGFKVVNHYDLKEVSNLNLFIQLINTYFPLERTKSLLSEI